MRQLLSRTLFAAVSLAAVLTVQRGWADEKLPTGAPAIVYGHAKPLPAWVRFCEDYPSECDGRSRSDGRDQIALNQETWEEIVKVNARVNQTIKPISDKDHWPNIGDRYRTNGAVDKWDLAEDGSGDCDEYVTVKRKLLGDLGYPRSALLPTVVIDELGEGHAVLTLVTDRGDMLLDNKVLTVTPANESKYQLVKRVDPKNPHKFQALSKSYRVLRGAFPTNRPRS